MSRLSVSVVIPVRNGVGYLESCLEHVRRLVPPPLECVVVDDGSDDASKKVARRADFRVISTGGRRGPAVARNLGARSCHGDILLFLDADVLVAPDALRRLERAFVEDPGVDAVIGSYDDQPSSPGLPSQYRNLLHCYIHQSSREQTRAFWTGCGAVRRTVFEAAGGFRETHDKPYLEDIEFGWRLHQAGKRIRLDKGLRVKHMKRWGFWSTLKTDLLDRAVPWTHLILRFRSMPADLNLRWGHRASVLLVCLLSAGAGLELVRTLVTREPAPWWMWIAGAAMGAVAVVALNRGFYRFLVERRGWWFAVRAAPLHALHYLVSGIGFGIGTVGFMMKRREARGTWSDSSGSSK